MSRTRSLTNLLTDIRWQADQLGATLRNDDASLTRALNQSIQRYREWFSEQGSPLYLTAKSGVLTVGATSPYSYGTLDMSAWTPTPVHVYTMEVTVNGRIYNVPRVPWEQRNDYQSRYADPLVGTHVGYPVGFFQQQQTLGIVPASDGAYPYTAWYMPLLPDLVSGGDTFDGIAGYEEWLVWDVMTKLVVRDQEAERYGMATAERDRIQQDILQRLRQDRPSVARREDRRGDRQRGRWAR